MQISLRPLSGVERVSRIGDKRKLIAESGVEASLLIETDDTSSMIYRLATATLNEKFKRQKSIVQTGGSVFITVSTPDFYNYKWWNYMKEQYKTEPSLAWMFSAVIAFYLF